MSNPAWCHRSSSGGDLLHPYLERLTGRLGVAGRPRTLRTPPELPSHYNVVMGGITCAGRPVSGSGFAQCQGLAMLKALGEFIERYALLTPRNPTAITVRRRTEIAAPALGAIDVPLFTEVQRAQPDFVWQGLLEDVPLEWVWCRGLGTAEDTYVPADFIWLDQPSQITLTGSTGAAAHRSAGNAILSAICEHIERDALSIMWETRAVTPLIDPDAFWHLDETVSLMRALKAARQNIWLRDLTTDLGVPVVAAVIAASEMRRPWLVMGAAADMDIGVAASAALREATAVWIWMRDEHSRLSLSLEEVRAHADRPTSPMWQAVLYGFPEMRDAAAPLIASADFSDRRPQPDPRTGPDAALETIVERLRIKGVHTYWRSILPSELAGFGWDAVRVVAPGLVPLGFGCRCRPLGHPRIYQVPTLCGWPHRLPDAPDKRAPMPLP